nr:MAG TPA: hypothetical protein [Caudoviricetes sp.]
MYQGVLPSFHFVPFSQSTSVVPLSVLLRMYDAYSFHRGCCLSLRWYC